MEAAAISSVRSVKITADGVRIVDAFPEEGAGTRVSVATSGICGSDLHLVASGPSPITLGHEFCGRLDDGTPVAVLPNRSCGRCERCRAGNEQQCAELFSSMYGITLDGGMADESWVQPDCAKVLPDRVRLEDACLVEPLAVAVHGLHRSGAVAGVDVVVIGDGPIGLCAVTAAGHSGISVDLAGHRAHRSDAGYRLGAGREIGRDYDIVLDAAGTQSSMDQAVELARPGGTIGLLGTFWDPVSVTLAMQMKELTLIPAFTYGHHHDASEFEDAIALLDTAPELPEAVITHRFPLSDAPEAFRVAGDRTSGAIKVVLHTDA